MAKPSAGILVYRWRKERIEVLLGHPGGPLWGKRDEGAWTIPKGQIEPGEDLITAALREFGEETGTKLKAPLFELGSIVQKGGKVVWCWGCEANLDISVMHSNRFEHEWPPKSGRYISVPELDEFGWFELDEAQFKINPAQAELLTRLVEYLSKPSE